MFKPLKTELDKMRIILATSSKQRHEIFRQAGVKFEVLVSNYPENLDRNKHTFSEYVQETAAHKVQEIAGTLSKQGATADVIIGMDTMVCCGDAFYGKPKDEEDAFNTIRHLCTASEPNTVLTGVCIKYKTEYVKFVESTKVFMRALSDEEIRGYIETGEPMGHAGSYAIQGIAASFIERIDGDFNNVIGLPLCAITNKLSELVRNDKTLC